jgi:hypothetical protein
MVRRSNPDYFTEELLVSTSKDFNWEDREFEWTFRIIKFVNDSPDNLVFDFNILAYFVLFEIKQSGVVFLISFVE